MTATYLYAITHELTDSDIGDLRGVGGTAVRVLHGDRMSCLVSTVDLTEFGEDALRNNLEDLAWLERTAREHDDVVRAGAALTATVPLRLATICLNDESARQRLNEFGEAARHALAKIDGHDEWGVKLFADRAASDPDPAEPVVVSGTAYLRQRRASMLLRERSAGRMLRVAEEIFESLAVLATDARRHRPHDRRLTGDDRPMVLNAAFLVDRQRLAAFRSAVDVLVGTDCDVSVDVTGPWPAYSFVPDRELEQDAET